MGIIGNGGYLLPINCSCTHPSPHPQGWTDPDSVLADWYFINPLHFQEAFDFLGGDGSGAFGGPTKASFNEGVCQNLLRALGESKMVHVAQKIGHEVYVPPGWVHSVFTKQSCVKLAWDYIVVENLPKYLAAWQHVGVRMPHPTEDYVNVMGAVVKHALQASKK